jgi:hypothetical protein
MAFKFIVKLVKQGIGESLFYIDLLIIVVVGILIFCAAFVLLPFFSPRWTFEHKL